MAEKKVWAQRSYRVALRRQSFSLLNVFPIRCRRLYSVLSKENAIFLVLRGGCRLSSPWLSGIPAANSRHNLWLPKTYCYRGGDAGGWLHPCNRWPVFQSAKAGQDAHARHKQYGVWKSGRLLFVLSEVENPLLSRLAAVRWALRWVESIIREPSKGVLFANSVKILLKTPSLLHLTKRLYSVLWGRTYQAHPSTEVRAWWRRWCRWRHACHPHGEHHENRERAASDPS